MLLATNNNIVTASAIVTVLVVAQSDFGQHSVSIPLAIWGQLDDFSAARVVNSLRSVDPAGRRRPPRSTSSSANRPIRDDTVTADLISSGVVVATNAKAVTIIDVGVVIADTYLGHAISLTTCQIKMEMAKCC
jgi:hypothetical protein